MNEAKELQRLREVLKAAQSVLHCQLPEHEQHGFSFSSIPNDRLNWLREVVTAVSEEAQ